MPIVEIHSGLENDCLSLKNPIHAVEDDFFITPDDAAKHENYYLASVPTVDSPCPLVNHANNQMVVKQLLDGLETSGYMSNAVQLIPTTAWIKEHKHIAQNSPKHGRFAWPRRSPVNKMDVLTPESESVLLSPRQMLHLYPDRKFDISSKCSTPQSLKRDAFNGNSPTQIIPQSPVEHCRPFKAFGPLYRSNLPIYSTFNQHFMEPHLQNLQTRCITTTQCNHSRQPVVTASKTTNPIQRPSTIGTTETGFFYLTNMHTESPITTAPDTYGTKQFQPKTSLSESFKSSKRPICASQLMNRRVVHSDNNKVYNYDTGSLKLSRKCSDVPTKANGNFGTSFNEKPKADHKITTPYAMENPSSVPIILRTNSHCTKYEPKRPTGMIDNIFLNEVILIFDGLIGTIKLDNYMP